MSTLDFTAFHTSYNLFIWLVMPSVRNVEIVFAWKQSKEWWSDQKNVLLCNDLSLACE